MSEPLTKHAFVDDNPFICYSPDEQASTSNISGGGGGDIPIASADTLGGVKIGEGLNITSEGVLSSSGGGSNVEIINASLVDEVYTLDKTFNQVKTLFDSGKAVIVQVSYGERTTNDLVIGYIEDLGNNEYRITANLAEYTTDDPDGYLHEPTD